MKSLKAAAVVAGSLALAGAAAPAFAYNTADITPTSLNGAVNTLTSGRMQPADVMPLQHQSDALDTENKDSVLNTVKGATTTLNSSGLLGGLPLQH
ncbi:MULTISPECIES: hypothetical protein [unclassified Streptomyces]|jgi:hypothetical protein|uniref:hypothetical protein n=1 Tax=unclassified Streptomyces TaxID=2593676 RepID=UPI000F4E87E5|nr:MULTISPECIES: hypothetical protein [unclassified Streptomyces]MDH6450294.1 hypothetical protein [Streptomyces sp. SAI-119]MDH6499163.1 hypothetical protein [Streptomyces sp. SAI-149]QUC62086.1 hypothetical protein IOD14_37915 [Streptomyces sp. A2-16]GLP65719.1 hypothetical protein TUSST3_23390 [Streptomyces sp. TUS-ST3]